YDAGPRRVSEGSDGLGRFSGSGVGMDPDLGEIVPEARLEIRPRCRIERLPRRAQHLVYGRWRPARGGWRHGRFFSKSPFAGELQRRGSEGDIRVRHAHQLLGDSIRLMLQRIIDGPDFEFRLNGSGETRYRKPGR